MCIDICDLVPVRNKSGVSALSLLAHCTLSLLAHCTLSLLAHCTLSVLAHCTLSLLAHCTLSLLAHFTLSLLAHCTLRIAAYCPVQISFNWVKTSHGYHRTQRFGPALTETYSVCLIQSIFARHMHSVRSLYLTTGP